MNLNVTVHLSPRAELLLVGQHREIMAALGEIMSDQASILAKIAALGTVLSTVAAQIPLLEDGHASINDEIQALKDQLATSQISVDWSKVDAALDGVTATAATIAGAIKEAPAAPTAAEVTAAAPAPAAEPAASTDPAV